MERVLQSKDAQEYMKYKLEEMYFYLRTNYVGIKQYENALSAITRKIQILETMIHNKNACSDFDNTDTCQRLWVAYKDKAVLLYALWRKWESEKYIQKSDNFSQWDFAFEKNYQKMKGLPDYAIEGVDMINKK